MRNDTSGELVAFRWFRAEATEWIKAPEAGKRREQWWLVTRRVGETYNPLDDELAAFRAFVETEPTRDGITAFAAAYGPLGAGGVAAPLLESGAGRETRGLETADPLALWDREIRSMRRGWELLNAGKRLADWIRFEPEAVLLDRMPDEVAVVAGPDSQLWPYLTDNEASLPERRRLAAQFRVQSLVNARLAKHAAPRLLFNPDSRRLELRLVPSNLLGALWLQLGSYIEGDDKDYRRCRVCHRWYEVSTEGKRPEAEYCSNRCRVRAYRKRQKEAVRRAAAGEPHTTIARDLGTNVKTLRGWLQAATRKGGS